MVKILCKQSIPQAQSPYTQLFNEIFGNFNLDIYERGFWIMRSEEKDLEERLRTEQEKRKEEQKERLREYEERLKKCEEREKSLKEFQQMWIHALGKSERLLVENCIRELSWEKEDLEHLISFKPDSLDIGELLKDIERNKSSQTDLHSPSEENVFYSEAKKKIDRPVRIDFDEDRKKAYQNRDY